MSQCTSAKKKLRAASKAAIALAGFLALAESGKAVALELDEDFRSSHVDLPNGVRTLYPDPKRWGFTLLPGIKWPDSFGNGTNFLESNGECQIYLSPFIEKVNGKPVPPALRYNPFRVERDGLHVVAAPLTQEQKQIYNATSFRVFGSGMLASKFPIRFATIKVKAKFPSAAGSWPAIWLLPLDGAWPPEIDILEVMAWRQHRTSLHSGIIGRKDEGVDYSAWFDVQRDVSAGFHEYELDWSEETLSMKFDGRLLWSKTTPDSMKQDMYLIINLAVGGKWVFNELGVKPTDGMSPDRLREGAKSIKADYPAEMVIQSIAIRSK